MKIMKARFFKRVGFGLALSAMPFIGARSPQASNAPQSLVTSAHAEPSPAVATNAVAATNTLAGPLAQPALETAPPPPENAPLPTPAPGTGKTLPPNITPSSPLGQVAKLAQSGVDESVMLTFVSNAASTFNLTSDEIIYLNDIGVSDSVVTAMIQRDQALKQSWAETTQAQNAAAQANAQAAQAAAPSYVDSPQPEAQPAEAAAQPANVTDNYFYDSLSPYGTWIDIDGYGRCWQPTVVVINRGWRPYCDRGRWLYTDAGWYWNSDYSWGWAPFHYGRWFSHPSWGWCWYPGYTWGPSWVTWRYSGDYCGWAPLPPAAYYQPGFGFYYGGHSVGIGFSFGLGAGYYTFVPWGRFCDSRPWHHRAPGTHVNQIYNNSTVINNVVTGDNNRIINHGVPIDRARRHAGSEIRQVAIRETSDFPRNATRGERLERGGRTLVVNRPDILQSPSAAGAPLRPTRDSQVGHMPVGGAGAAAQLEPSRAQSRDRVTPAVSGSPRATPSQVNPSTGGDRGTPRGREERPVSPGPNYNRQNNRSSTASPLILQGGERVTSAARAPSPQSGTSVTSPAAQRSPAGSLVVIGRRDSNSGRNRIADNASRSASARTETPAQSTRASSAAQPAPITQPSVTAPRVETPRVSSSQSSAALSYNRPLTQTPRSTPAPAYSAPRSSSTPSYTPAPSGASSYSTPRSTPAPSYSAPTYSAPRSSSTPSYTPAPSRAPSYSAPRSMPAPSYSAPAYSAPRSSPAPSPSYTPAPSRTPSTPAPAQDRSGSGGHGSSRRN